MKSPAHIIKLELDRSGVDVPPLCTLRLGDVKLRLANDPLSLVKWHMRRALLRRRQELLADRVYMSAGRPAITCASRGPRSQVASAPFAEVFATG